MTDSQSKAYRKHDVPEDYLSKWQETINVLANVFEVPAGLIMRVLPEEIEVLVSSQSKDNPYDCGEKAKLNTGLYCETVMETQAPLHVPNAREDPEWDANPDIELNMTSYLGMPLIWPDGRGEDTGARLLGESRSRCAGAGRRKVRPLGVGPALAEDPG